MEQPKNQRVVQATGNPLENNLILRQLFGFCPPQTLKNIRLVSQLWNRTCLPAWKAVACPISLPDDLPSPRGLTYTQVLTDFQNNPDTGPFQGYKLNQLEINLVNPNANSTSFNLWLDAVGPHITQLNLIKVNFILPGQSEPFFENILTAGQSMSPLLNFLIEKTPNLKKLTMDRVRVNGKIPLYSDLNGVNLTHPKVTSLTCRKFYGFQFLNFPNLEEVFLDSFNLEKFMAPNSTQLSRNPDFLINSTIRRLHLQGTPYVHGQACQFPALEHLSIVSSDNDSVAWFLTDFLPNHKHLKSLTLLFSVASRPPTSFITEEYPCLTEMQIYGNVFENLRFLRFTPNLQRLHMDLYGFDKQPEMKRELTKGQRSNGQVHLITQDIVNNTPGMGEIVVESLEYFQLNYRLLPGSLQKLRGCMPNLKRFRSAFDQFNFGIVCDLWPELEELGCTYGSTLKDENIGGAGQNGKSLVDLKCLKSFKYHAGCDRSAITDAGITLELLRLPNLTEFHICAGPQLTEPIEMKLREQFSSARVYRNYSANPLHINWQCCRDNEFAKFIFNYRKYWAQLDCEDGESDTEPDLSHE